MLFRDVIGQEPIKQHLRDMVIRNRLSHALLFLGKEGTGTLPLALALAQFLVCEKAGSRKSTSPSLFGEPDVPDAADQPIDSCGTCPACQKAGRLIHPDIHFTYPVITKKTGEKPVSADFIEQWRSFIDGYPYGNSFDWLQFIDAGNKQGNITASECNDIIRKLSLKSFESGFKILVLWLPEYLGNEGNKLLKLIEEPPDDTLFMLVAESEADILPTILSRTRMIRLPPIETEEVEKALVERAKLSPAEARQIASVSEGNYRQSSQLLQHAGEDWQAMIRDWLNAIMKTGPASQVRWIEDISKYGRERQKQFLRYFNHLLEQAIRVQIMDASSLKLPDDERDFAVRLNKMAGISQQQAIIEELDRATYYIERNANAKMLFHALTIKLYHIIADKSLILIA